MTCSATVPERLVYSPTIIISYDLGAQSIVADDNPSATESLVYKNSNVFSRVVTIDPVKTSDAREYYCIVSFGSPLNILTSISENIRISCEFIKVYLL